MAPTSKVVRSPASRAGGAGELFQMLRDGRPRTRADLAARTGQARSTIAARVDQLLASGLVTPTGESASTGGRPPTTFVFNPGARLVVAVDLGALHGHVAITDLAANVLAERSEPLPIHHGPDDILDWVARTGLGLLAQSGRSLDEVVGVGVGLPGPVNHETGRLTHPPIMPGWDDYDVPARLSSVFRTSVLVDNDVNIMALGEYHTAWRTVDHLLFVKIATGIGAGIINDGRLSRGAQGAAGDLGHVAVAGREDVPCRCGNAGCLEAVASGQAIAQSLRRQGLDVPGSDEVVTAVRAGSLLAGQTVRQAGRDIGGVLATCVSLLNPAVIVLGGIVAEAGEYLLAGIREVVYRRSLPLATQHLRIVSSQAKEHAGILGASIMVTDHVLSPSAVDALLA